MKHQFILFFILSLRASCFDFDLFGSFPNSQQQEQGKQKQVRIKVQKIENEQDTFIQNQENHLELREYLENGEMLMKALIDNKYKIVMRNHHNIQYIGVIYIGESLKPFNVIFDTGSEWLWLAESECDDCPERIKKYECRTEVQFCKFLNKRKSIKYGRGFVSGTQANISISFDGENRVSNMQALLAKKIQDLNGFQADGLMGVGPSQSREGASHSILDLLKAQNKISKRIFSFYFSDNTGIKDKTSELIFGDYDQEHADGPVVWHKLISNSRWLVNLEQVKLGEHKINTIANNALIDSGSSFLIMSLEDYAQIIQLLTQKYNANCQERSGKYYCDGDYKQFPELIFKINGVNYKLGPENYVDSQGKIMISGRSYSRGRVILGDVFFRKYYCIFDADDRQIGITKIKNTLNKQ